MQRFINDPDLVVEDMLKGFAKCHKDLVAPIEENPRVLMYVKAPIKGKVGVVTGGGSGHKPAFIGAGDDVVALVSGLGATPAMELYIAFSKAYDILADAKINVHRSYVGNYFTSLEMMGISFTLMKVDDELKALVDLEAESVGLTQLAR